MIPTLFLQSEIQNPYEFYETMLFENPVYWDGINNLWAVYSYEHCKALLTNPSVFIPATSSTNGEALNEYALMIVGNMARLSNAPRHEMARQIVMSLVSQMKQVSTHSLMETLFAKKNKKDLLDWAECVGKKLPVLAVLKRFEFNDNDCEFILGCIGEICKIMSPNKSPEQVNAINGIAKGLYMIIEKQLQNSLFYPLLLGSISEKYKITSDETALLCTSNLVSLLIQSYDAGRGLLSNALLQIMSHQHLLTGDLCDPFYIEKCVTETLRFDPAVHNTRRVAMGDIVLGNSMIKEGSSICIMLAAANRDALIFSDPGAYNIERVNNGAHLAFGAGDHNCAARHVSTALTIEALVYLFGRYPSARLAGENICYESLINVRLPKNLFISLS